MNVAARRAFGFGLRFLPVFLVLLWIYPKILPSYAQLVIGAANRCLAAFSPRLLVEVGQDGHARSWIVRPDGGPPSLIAGASYPAKVMFSSLVLVAALLLATPMKFSRLLRPLTVGLVMIYTIHVLAVMVLPHSRLALYARPRSFGWAWLGVTALTSGQVGAFAVWALLSWGYWFSVDSSPPGEVDSSMIPPAREP